MNTTQDIELPPLPTSFVLGYAQGTIEDIENYARTAIEPYVKRIAELEAARIAYASEFAPDEDGNPDVGSIHENIRKLKASLQSQDAEDAERYRWLCDKFGITKLPCAIERIIAGDVYVADGKAGIDEAIDHARRAEGGWE